MLVKNRMTSPAMTVTPETSFQDALRLMRDHKFRRIPVVDHDGKLVGIVARADLIRALAIRMAEEVARPAGSAAPASVNEALRRRREGG